MLSSSDGSGVKTWARCPAETFSFLSFYRAHLLFAFLIGETVFIRIFRFLVAFSNEWPSYVNIMKVPFLMFSLRLCTVSSDLFYYTAFSLLASEYGLFVKVFYILKYVMCLWYVYIFHNGIYYHAAFYSKLLLKFIKAPSSKDNILT